MKKPPLIFTLFLLLCGISYADEIPEEQQVLMNFILKKEFNIDRPETIERLTGGFSSPGLYKITADSRSFVVRFCNPERSLRDRKRELDAMLISSKRGIAPIVYYGDASEGIIIMEYIASSHTADGFNPLTDENLKALATSMRTVHEGPAFKEHLSVFDVARHFENTLKGERPATVVRARALIDDLQAQLRNSLESKPCHNDLNPNNILYRDGRVYFVDWEAACQGDPYFDLTTPLVLYSMTAAQEATLLYGYFGRDPSADELAKFGVMKKFSSIYYGFALIMVSQMRGAEFMSQSEIDQLPRPNELPHVNIAKDALDVQKIGFAFLRETMRL